MSNEKKIFVFAPMNEPDECLRQFKDAGCTLAFGDTSWQTPSRDIEDQMCKLAEGAVAIMGQSNRSTPITRRIMEAAGPQLRVVAKYMIGVDEIDVDAATDMGIMVTNAPTEANWGGVAEGTMAMMLGLLKKLRERDDAVMAGKWRSTSPELQGIHLGRRLSDDYAGITVGIVGLGRVGRRVAELLAPWRVRLLACDPYVEPSRFSLHNCKAVDLPTLLRESDVVSLHVTLTKETKGLIGTKEFALMKPSAVLINTSRGPVVDEMALVEALKGDKISAAALDVFDKEPLQAGSPLRELGRKVLLSPHMISWNVRNGPHPGMLWAMRTVLKVLDGAVPDNVFNKEVVPRWQERFGGKKL
jgi:phosphoglycerate dehydrogenase-like enzyme